MEILKVENLNKTYIEGTMKTDVLKNICLSLRQKEFAAVVGDSGSGKSVLLNCISALEEPTSGKVTIDGYNLMTMTQEERTIFRRRNIGFIFRNFGLAPELTVEQNIIFPLLLDCRRPKTDDMEKMLSVLGLEKQRACLPQQLSGGQKQRVAIGRAIISGAGIILADEPTGELDSRSGQEIIDILAKIPKQYGRTVLLMTHHSDLSAAADRVFHMSDGKLTDLGGVADEKIS